MTFPASGRGDSTGQDSVAEGQLVLRGPGKGAEEDAGKVGKHKQRKLHGYPKSLSSKEFEAG